jgi:hypothetical protein
MAGTDFRSCHSFLAMASSKPSVLTLVPAFCSTIARRGPHVLLTNAAPIAGYPDLGGAIAVLKTTE